MSLEVTKDCDRVVTNEERVHFLKVTKTGLVLLRVFKDIEAKSDDFITCNLNRSGFLRRQVLFFRVESKKPLSFTLYSLDNFFLRLSRCSFWFLRRLKEELSNLGLLVTQYFVGSMRSIFDGLVIQLGVGNIESKSQHTRSEVTVSSAVVNKAVEMRTDLCGNSWSL